MPPVDIIFDTDMSIDVDDVGALCALHALADRGEANLLAAVHNSASPRGVGALAVLNSWYGRGDIPVGFYGGRVGDPAGTSYASPWGFSRLPPARPWQIGPYVDDLVDRYPSRVRNASDADGDALSVLRRTLHRAAQPVTIVSVGYFTNLYDLLRSVADAESPLDGVELVRTKVARLVVMGGRHKFHLGEPVEWNLAGANDGISVCGGKHRHCGEHNNLGAISNATLEMWPDEVERVFVDFETGVSVWTGGALVAGAPADSPCRRAYEVFCRVNIGWCNAAISRCSWDILAAVYAVRGLEDIYTLEAGHNVIDPATGHNEWLPLHESSADASVPAPREFSLVLPVEKIRTVEDEISQLLIQPRPGLDPTRPPPPPPLPPPPSPTPPPLQLSTQPIEPSPLAAHSVQLPAAAVTLSSGEAQLPGLVGGGLFLGIGFLLGVACVWAWRRLSGSRGRGPLYSRSAAEECAPTPAEWTDDELGTLARCEAAMERARAMASTPSIREDGS